MKYLSLIYLLFVLSACSSLNQEQIIDKSYNMSEIEDHREEAPTPSSTSEFITDSFISITTLDNEEVSGFIRKKYTSAIGELCWKIETMNNEIVSACKDGKKIRISRNIISGSI